jgi:hypothetical protein
MKWLALTAVVFIATCLGWLGSEGQVGDHRQGAGSSLDHDGEGLSLARAYLQENGRRRTALLGRELEHAALPDDGVLLRVQPGRKADWLATLSLGKRGTKPVAEVLSPAEERWLERGGRLVLAVADGWGGLDTVEGGGALARLLPSLPGVLRIVPPVPRTLGGTELAQGVAVFALGGKPLIVRRAVGAGDLWLLACPEVLSNGHLAEADHLGLLLALVGEQRPVWFDEHAHGVTDGLGVVELLRRWALGPALALGVLLTALWFWRQRAILGRPADPWRDLRAEAVEGVDALAGLYQRTLSRRDALELYRQRLLREVILRTGQRPLVARATVERLTGGLRLPAGEPAENDFHLFMHRLNQAFRSFRDEHRSRRP